MTLKDQLLRDAVEFCEKRRISEARLGFLVVNDGKFFTRVRGGGSFTTATYEKFQRYFAEQRAAAPDAA